MGNEGNFFAFLTCVKGVFLRNKDDNIPKKRCSLNQNDKRTLQHVHAELFIFKLDTRVLRIPHYIVSKCFKNHHAEFEIERTILRCLHNGRN